MAGASGIGPTDDGDRAVRIRQVALCTDDIWREERRLAVELEVAAVHRDPPNVFAMRNTVFAVGDTFLEVLQPEDDNAPSARYLSTRGGPGGYMLILQVDDLEAARARVEELGIRIVFDARPATVHGVTAASIHLHPADTGGTLVSLDHMDPAEGWAWAGRAWQRHVHTDVVDGIVGVELTTAEPDRLVDRLARLLDRSSDAGRSIECDGGYIRVAAAPAGVRDRLSAVEMRATDRARAGSTVVVSGTELRLV